MRRLGLFAAVVVTLSGCLCGKPAVVENCVDKDGDGASVGCSTSTDCDDTTASRRPSAPEICNGGIDDDCDPATVESCPPADAGTCMCTDDPNDCSTIAPCALDAGAPMCVATALPDRTACVRVATDGGAGLCQSASCVECIDVSDCASLNASATVCDLVTCNAGRCESVRRHDSTSWKVTPPQTADVIVNRSATPIKAMWDGQNFAVAVRTLDGGAVVRRISRDGTILDPDGFPIDPATEDIAYSGDRFLAVTSEPANGGAQPFDYVAGQFMSYDGGANGAKTALIFDLGNTNPNAHFATPTVAGSSGGTFMVTGAATQYPWTKYVTLPSGPSGEISSPFLPRYPVVTGAANGFALATQDLSIDGGRSEVGGAFFPNNGPAVPYAIRAPFNPPVDPDLPGACCAGSARLVSNGASFLLAYTWDGVQGVYRPFDANLQPTAPRTVFASSTNQLYQQEQPVEVASDGANFLIVELPGGESLKVMRVTPQGALLDPAPFEVTDSDIFRKSQPHLVSDGQGRNLLLYRKTEGATPNTYVRLFTTCP